MPSVCARDQYCVILALKHSDFVSFEANYQSVSA